MTWERHETTWYVVIMVCFSVFFGFARKLWIYPSCNFLTNLRFFGDNFYLRSRKAPWACTKTLVFKNRTIWHENGTESLVMWRKWYFFQFFFGFACKLWIYPSCNFLQVLDLYMIYRVKMCFDNLCGLNLLLENLFLLNYFAVHLMIR